MNRSPWQPLIDRHLDGSATPEDASRLALALLDDPEVARAYARATRLEAGLRQCLQSESAARRLAVAARSEKDNRRRSRVGLVAAAAALVVGGVCLGWWRPWDRTGTRLADGATAERAPRVVNEAPPPPPSLRRPGVLSPEAMAVKRLAERYWLPERMEFAGTPLIEAVTAVQRQAATLNFRQNPIVSRLAVDIPEEMTSLPITAVRAELPLAAWLELLAAQTGCELRFTAEGVVFEAVERPEIMETRRFALPSIPDTSAPDGAAGRLYSASHPWMAEPAFGSAPPHGTRLAADWGVPTVASSRVVVRDDHSVEVRHTRRELRRIEGLLAVATADAARPRVVFRAKEVRVPSAGATGASADASGMGDHASMVAAVRKHLDLGLGYYDLGEFEKACEAFRQVLKIDPYNTAARRQLDRTERRISEYLLAARDHTRAKMLREVEENWEMPMPQSFPAPTGGRVVANEEAVSLLGPSLSNLPLVTAWSDDYGTTSETQTWSFIIPPETVASAKNLALGRLAESHRTPRTDWVEMTETQPMVDPWQQAARGEAKIGEPVQLATGEPAVQAMGSEMLSVGFSLLDLKPRPLTVAARLEGELVKLTGTFTPSEADRAPTDFQVYVGEGQSFVLETEDAPAVGEATVMLGDAVTPMYLLGFDIEETVDMTRASSDVQSDDIEIVDASITDFLVGASFTETRTTWGLQGGQPESDDYLAMGTSVNGVLEVDDFNVVQQAGSSESAGPVGSGEVRAVVISPVLEWPSTVTR